MVGYFFVAGPNHSVAMGFPRIQFLVYCLFFFWIQNALIQDDFGRSFDHLLDFVVLFDNDSHPLVFTFECEFLVDGDNVVLQLQNVGSVVEIEIPYVFQMVVYLKIHRVPLVLLV